MELAAAGGPATGAALVEADAVDVVVHTGSAATGRRIAEACARLGRKAVLYFYPRDDTSGCTLEAVQFTARLPEFEAAGTAVFGISRDSVRSHCRFRDKHALGVRLLSDESGDAVERFGVWREKSMYGRTYMGVARSTFIIDADGVVAHVIPKASPKTHDEQVLALLAS